MRSIIYLLLGCASLTSAGALGLGIGEKFQVVPGGKAFDRFITIWLENQVRQVFSSALVPCSALAFPDTQC